MIADVRYMPPALGSTVSYAHAQSTGSATSVSSSFSKSQGGSISVGFSIPLSSIGVNTAYSFNTTWTNGHTESVSLVRTETDTDRMTCESPYCDDYINHNTDLITILARPAVRYHAFSQGIALPAGYKYITWGLDLYNAVEVPLRVGWLNGTIPCPPNVVSNLRYLFGIDSPDYDATYQEILRAEYNKILAATGYGYPDQVVIPDYGGWIYPWMGNWPPDPDRFAHYHTGSYADNSLSWSLVTTNGEEKITSDTDTSSYSRSLSVSAGLSVNTPIMGAMLMSMSGNKSWTWTHTVSETTTVRIDDTDAVSVNHPAPDYGGPIQLNVFIDKIYHTFMFSYCSAQPNGPDLMMGCVNGPPLPAVVTGLSAVAAAAQSPISVAWTPVMGAVSYDLLRSTDPSLGFVSVAPAGHSAFAFADATALDRSVAYYYKVTAANDTGTGAESALTVVPAAPSNLTVSVTPPTVYLGWSPAAAATSYTVWRSAGTSTSYAELPGGIGITTLQLTDSMPPAGTSYYYVVTASSATGSSARSNEARVLAAPPVPTGVAARAGNGWVVVSWSAATGATTYNLLRSTNNSTWSTFTGSTGVTNTYLANYPLTNGVTYYYKVQALNAGGASAYSSVVSARPVAPPPPPPPPCGGCPYGYHCCGDYCERNTRQCQ
jgi:hypothetical protein